MNQHTTYNPTTISPPVNTIQPVAPPPQYIPTQQDTFINTSAPIPEPMKPFDGLDHSYTPEEYLQQVEARLTFAIGEEPQNNPVKYRSRHNRRMAYIQFSLIGTALNWNTSLHISYKQQWNSFVQFFKKQFSSRKTAYYAQVEAMSLMKKDNETVRHFAHRVQYIVKKGWCNESASTINLKNNEIFTKGLPKKVKDFAHRRQVKHVSTLLEPSIPFHTLVRHVDSEDIANEKIRTNDLTLEINKVLIEDDNNKESEHDQIMVTQSGDPNNKSKPALRKYCSSCHKNNHGISNCYQKQRDEEYQRYKSQRSRTPQQSFLQYFRSKPNNSQEKDIKIKVIFLLETTIVIDIIKITTLTIPTDIEITTDIEATVEIIHKIIIDLILDKDITIDLQVHTHLDPDMTTIIKEELHPDPHIDHHTETTPIIDIIHDQDIDLVLNHKETPLDDIITHIDLHLDQEIIDQDLEHPHKTDNKTE